MIKTREIAVILSGIVSFTASTCFALTVFLQDIPQNIATWAMVLILDFIGLILVISDGNKKPYLQIGWTISAFCIVSAIIFNDSPWHWGIIESASSILCAISIVIWIKTTAHKALWAYMVASYTSCYPLIKDYWYSSQPETIWIWLCTIAACLLAIYGAPKRDFANVFIPWNAIIINGTLTMLCVL